MPIDCWNGVDVDSPNHRSHVAYGNGPSCPSTYPKRIPQITFETIWWTDDYDIKDIFLSTGDNAGYCEICYSFSYNQGIFTDLRLQHIM
jgi:hypothetical protein